jgi:predicted nucleic acid-binding protein
VRYVESSALVTALLEHDAGVVKKVPRGTQLVTSALTLAEAGRAITRAARRAA